MTWILVANASEAYLYSSPRAKLFEGSDSLTLIHDYEHPQSRQKSGDLISDRSGRRQAKRAGHGTFVEAADPKAREAELFAKEIVEKLDEDYLNNQFQDLIVAAPPHFHGFLNKYLKNKLSNIISASIEKDYTKYTPKQLIAQLQTYV